MTVIWFSDEDRERMRREREAVLEEEPYGLANRNAKVNARMALLDIRPWTARPGEEHSSTPAGETYIADRSAASAMSRLWRWLRPGGHRWP